ncbi:MAG: discoidin domain-containing protein, partial [Candidatus Staskawiczbacteria bacterium]|nr:discoidin domain-containing protein [Candidatus Staskawiczbacteria bacterium]
WVSTRATSKEPLSSNPAWLEYNFGVGNSQIINTYTIINRNWTEPTSPNTWNFQGSNDGTTWVDLDSISGDINNTQAAIRTFNFFNATAYQYYRINIKASNSKNNVYNYIVAIGELQMNVPVNGVCGSANGSFVSTTKPLTATDSSLCSTGKATSFSGTGPWTWACASLNGGLSAVCAASIYLDVVNGVCGSANGSSFPASKPLTATDSSLCLIGQATSFSGTGPWTWGCAGLNGGLSAVCTASVSPINGVCDSANGQTFSTAPTTNLCSSGTAVSVYSDGTTWHWGCAGLNGGLSAVCTASVYSTIVNGVCGSANGQAFSSAPTAGSNGGLSAVCAAATATAAASITVTSPNSNYGSSFQIGNKMNISWTSMGLPVNATLSIGINGDGQTSTMAGAQIATNVLVSTGTYSWIIPAFLGENLAEKKYDVYVNYSNTIGAISNGYFTIVAPTATPINGACGSANGVSVSTAPTTNLCSTGTASALLASPFGVTSWSWNCMGSGIGATTASCSTNATVPTNGVCGTANGQAFSSAPITNLCSVGSVYNFSGSGPWTWTCLGVGMGPTLSANCSTVNPAVNGVCGSANGGLFIGAPTTNLCSTGTASIVSGAGPWTWSCLGSGTGATTASCSTYTSTAPPSVAGVCGSANGQAVSTVPTGSALCASGTVSNLSGSG